MPQEKCARKHRYKERRQQHVLHRNIDALAGRRILEAEVYRQVRGCYRDQRADDAVMVEAHGRERDAVHRLSEVVVTRALRSKDAGLMALETNVCHRSAARMPAHAAHRINDMPVVP